MTHLVREASQTQPCGVHAYLQEAEGSHVAVRPERRRQAIEELVAAGPQALQVLAACLTQDGEHGESVALTKRSFICAAADLPD